MLSTYVNDISTEFKKSGRHIAEEAKDKKEEEGNDGGKERAANVKTCTL